MSISLDRCCIGVTLLFVMAACGEFYSPTLGTDEPFDSAPIFPVPPEVSPSPDVTPPPCSVALQAGWFSNRDYSTADGMGAKVTTVVGDTNYFELTATGDLPESDPSWFIKSGQLPPGFALDPKEGRLLGYSIKPGIYSALIGMRAVAADGSSLSCEPLALTIDVESGCNPGTGCTLDDFAEAALTCRALPDLGGEGHCMRPVKPESCPTANEYVQLAVAPATLFDPDGILRISGTVEHHHPCRETRFSLHRGGIDGHCLIMAVDPEHSPGYPLEEAPVVVISYRLPANYRAPIIEGGRYAIHYSSNMERGWSHNGGETLLVFEDYQLASGDGSPGSPLVLAAHSGRQSPRQVLDDCALHGRCPRLSSARVVPTDCERLSSSLCGQRTPGALLVKDEKDRESVLLAGGGPTLFGESRLTSFAKHSGRDPDAARNASAGQPPYALHLAAGDVFAGEDALRWATDCYGAEEDLLLSYSVLPSASCVQARVARMGESLAVAPARLLVRYEDLFSPAGRPVEIAWRVFDEPKANTLFDNVDPLLDGHPKQDFLACVPGYYRFGVEVTDEIGTPSCGEDETTVFAVEPPGEVYVELLSPAVSAGLELRVAPLYGTLDESTDPGDGGEVARLDNPIPDWARDEWGQPLAMLSNIIGCGRQSGEGRLQVFQALAGLKGRYGIFAVFPLAAEPPAEISTVEIHIRAIIDKRLTTTQRRAVTLEIGEAQLLGVLELDGDLPSMDSLELFY